MQADDIVLGRKYKDKIHGIEGVAIAMTRWLTGCDRVCLEFVKEGEIKDYWFDVTRLVEVEGQPEPVTLDAPKSDPGGPRPTPPSRDPSC